MGEKRSFAIVKADDDLHRVFGWANVAIRPDGEQITDYQEDVVDPEDLENAAYNFVLYYRTGGELHQIQNVATLIESCVFTAEKQQAMGLPDGALPIGWWIGFQVNNDGVWAKVKDGTYSMFSIEGTAVREEITEDGDGSGDSGVKKKENPLTFSEIVVFYNLPFSHLLKYNQNHGKDGRFSSDVGGGVSAKGSNKFKSGFSDENLNIHWGKHKREYPGMTKAQYAKCALDLAQKPCGGNILGYLSKKGRVVRYDKATGDFVSGHPDVGIATMMKLSVRYGKAVGLKAAGKRFGDLRKRDEKL